MAFLLKDPGRLRTHEKKVNVCTTNENWLLLKSKSLLSFTRQNVAGVKTTRERNVIYGLWSVQFL